jgi:aryl-alcohol dehydrogenase-like predicted oxidoreductase
MQYKTLGNTGLLVSQICLGTMTFAGDDPAALSENANIWKTIGGIDQASVDALVQASVEAGVNFIDTADVYSEGKSEISLGKSLKNLNIARKDEYRSQRHRPRHQGLRSHRPWPQRRRRVARTHYGRSRGQPAPPANRLHRSLSDPRQ